MWRSGRRCWCRGGEACWAAMLQNGVEECYAGVIVVLSDLGISEGTGETDT